MMDHSAPLDLEVLEVGNQANTGPAFGFHLVEILETAKISSSIRTSCFSSLLADRVSSTNIVDTGNLLGLSALLGMCKQTKQGEEYNNQSRSHL